MRPIVCFSDTALNYLIKWMDYWLQQMKPFVKTYIQDSSGLLKNLKVLGPLPAGDRLFAANEYSMYTNIDTTHVVLVCCPLVRGSLEP